MKTESSRVLGGKGIRAICKKHHLSSEDREVVERILRKRGNSGNGLEIGEGLIPEVMRIIEGNPRWRNILRAVVEIKIICRLGIPDGSGNGGNGHNGPNSSFS